MNVEDLKLINKIVERANLEGRELTLQERRCIALAFDQPYDDFFVTSIPYTKVADRKLPKEDEKIKGIEEVKRVKKEKKFNIKLGHFQIYNVEDGILFDIIERHLEF
ncbi:MAG: hypothetical protein Nk1A_4660 [Endomicrobiia bacterium]|nr:MAG: hypothetical protein Nk1A_4660 [Endomicrobiia bacterium]